MGQKLAVQEKASAAGGHVKQAAGHVKQAALATGCLGDSARNSCLSAQQTCFSDPRAAQLLPEPSLSTVSLGGGSFWCAEAVFQRVEGVAFVVSGYMGGHTENPTYKEVRVNKHGWARGAMARRIKHQTI